MKTHTGLFGFPFILLCVLAAGCSLLESETDKAERYYQAGVMALEAEKADEAEIHFMNAIQKIPFHAKAHYQMGLLYIQKKQLYLAVRELNTAIKQDPGLYEAKQALILLSYHSRGHEHAVSLCEDFIRNRGDDLKVLTIWGDSLLNLKKSKDALGVLKKAVEAYPEDPEARIYLAKALLAQNQRDDALQMMEKAARLAPDDISVRIALARFYETVADHNAAEKAYLEICSAFPKDPMSYDASAQHYLRRNRLDEAQAILSRAFSSGLKGPRLHRTLGQIHHYRKEFEQALQSLHSAVAGSKGAELRENLMFLADYLVFLRDRSTAISTYEKILEGWPDAVSVDLRIVELMISEGRDGEAKTRADRIIAVHPDNAYAHLLRGLLFVKDGRVSEARKEFNAARSLAPDSPEPHYYYGLTFLSEGDYKISLSEVCTALEKAPNLWPARLALAFIHYKTGKSLQSIEILDRILAEQPGNHRARLLRGSAYQKIGNHERATADYRYAIEHHPGLPETALVRLRLAECYESLGKLDESLAQLSILLDSGTDTQRPLERMVRIHMRNGDYVTALDLCDARLEKEPANIGVALLKSEVLIHDAPFETAKIYISELIEKNPLSDRAYFLMGKLYQKQGDLRSSVEMFHKYNHIGPKNTEGYIELANTYQFMEKLAEAAQTYEEFIHANGFSAAIGNDLAYLYAELGRDLDKALELANKAWEAMPGSPGVADTLGWVLLKRRSPVPAKKYLEEAVRIQPDNPLILYHLGVAEYDGHRFDHAQKRLQEAIDLGLGGKEKTSAATMMENIRFIEKTMRSAENLERRGECEEAISACEELVRKVGFHAPAGRMLARLYADSGTRLDFALQMAEKSLSHDPDNPEAADALGWVYLKKGSPLLAKKYFHEAVRLDPKVSKFHYHLGIAMNEQRDFSGARRALRTAVDLGLHGEQAEHARKMLERKGDAQ